MLSTMGECRSVSTPDDLHVGGVTANCRVLGGEGQCPIYIVH
jgi:hypothetical protein